MRIDFHRTFKKQYKKAHKLVQNNFADRLRLFERDRLDPTLNNHPLTGDRKGEWSINVTGDWRAVYEYTSETSVVFLEIGTHSNLYKK